MSCYYSIFLFKGAQQGGEIPKKNRIVKLLRISLLNIVACTVLIHTSAVAAPAIPFEVELEQLGGISIKGFVKGDERRHWYETIDGYTIAPLQSASNGISVPGWYYVSGYDAEGKPVTTNVIATTPPPRGISPGIRPTTQFEFEGFPVNTVGGESLADRLSRNSLTGEFGGQVVMLLVEYGDTPGSTLTNDWQKTLQSGVFDYYDKASYGVVALTAAQETSGNANDGIIGWLNLGAKHPDPAGNFSAVHQSIVSEAIVAADPFIDYSSYDANADGFVSSNELSIVVVVAGSEGTTAGRGPSVWGHTWCFSRIPLRVVDGVELGNCSQRWSYSMIGEMQQSHQSTLGIIVHELGHLIFNLPDLYDIDGSSKGINQYGIMGFGGWGKKSSDDFPGETPVLPSAWTKVTMGWVDPDQGTGTDTLTAAGHPNADQSNSVLKISTSNPDEYFLVENRQETGFDEGLASWSATPFCGLAVWHIDDRKATNRNDQDRWVDLEEADGVESESNDNLDLFEAPRATVLDISSMPSSKTKSGKQTGIIIRNISQCLSEVMTAEFTRPVNDLISEAQVTGDRAGSAVSIDGDNIAVGARLDDVDGVVNAGGVSLYSRSADNVWTRVKDLKSLVPQKNARFGNALEIDRKTLVVGENLRHAKGFRSGALTVFKQDNGGSDNWGPLVGFTEITAAETTIRDQFGSSVAIDGSVVVAGAPFANGSGGRSGAAYVFDLDGEFDEVRLLPDSGTENARFGGAVGTSADIIVVGASSDSTGFGRTGSAYVFERDKGGMHAWGLAARLADPSGSPDAQFGYSVAVHGNTIAVGSRHANFGPITHTGAVDIYQKSGPDDSWIHKQKLQPGDLNGAEHFGSSVSLHSDVMVVGAPGSADLANQAGKAYVFAKDQISRDWEEVQHLHNEFTSLRDQFGFAVGVDQFRFLIGSWLDNRTKNNSGAAYIFSR